MGFFGKGTLSRSEPSWLDREKARVRKERYGGNGRKAAEDATNARREERRLFKLERARLERERIDQQRLVEQRESDVHDEAAEADGVAKLTLSNLAISDADDGLNEGSLSTVAQNGSVTSGTTKEDAAERDDISTRTQGLSIDENVQKEGRMPDAELFQATGEQAHLISTPEKALQQTPLTEQLLLDEVEPEPDIEDQEHLQLTLEEAFFLAYGLGVLSIFAPRESDSPPMSPKSHIQPYATHELLDLFRRHASFPTLPPTAGIAPDDQFLLNYVTYHHFRSLGWVVRPGVKFGVDYLLYNRGPVFSHAEFAILIIPSYSHRDWNSPGGRSRRRVDGQKDWWWLHCVNRVQSQVKKTLVLCYVDVPSPFGLDLEESSAIDVGALLKSYKIREFVVRRWLANRSRD